MAAETESHSKALAFDPDRGGLQLQNTEDMLTYAKILLREGLVGKHFKTPAQVVICLQAGAEVGLPFTVSTKYIAPINNVPTIWGEAAKGLVLRSGEVTGWEDWWTENGARVEAPGGERIAENLTAYTRLTRKGGAQVMRSFSVHDAKRARLWGKAGPWTDYPFRMLRVRAMSHAMRDLFADKLGGLGIREEVLDSPAPEREAEYVDVSDLGPALPIAAPEGPPLGAEQPHPGDGFGWDDKDEEAP